ncbi:MAG: M23 family metallopeptidase [bacterium]
MNKIKVLILLISSLTVLILTADMFYLPFRASDRRVLKDRYITPSGEYGIWRKPYNNIPGHFHSGIDFKNPGSRPGEIEPVFSCSSGRVVSVLNNGSSSSVIIRHRHNGGYIYSTYTHITDIVVSPGDSVSHRSVIASFIDKPHLDVWGEYLNHLHFEILKKEPMYIGIRQNTKTYLSYSIECRTGKQLNELFYNPRLFFIFDMY